MDPSQYTEYRPLMLSIAYRMTGSVSDAEDIVQEAFLRAGKEAEVTSPRAYLATITTRLAIDHLRSARVRRESYVGTWLPEPLIGTSFRDFGDFSGEPDPAELAETSDSLSMAFLVLLESLAPAERAVFLLREVFGYDYREIAGITGKTEAACRQIFPLFGREQVAEVIRIQVGRILQLGASLRAAWVNRQPGVLACDADGDLIAVIALDVLDGQVLAIRTVANPEKLQHVGPVSQTWHLRWSEQGEKK